MKLTLNTQQKKNLQAINNFYNTPQGKEARLKGYEWASKNLDN